MSTGFDSWKKVGGSECNLMAHVGAPNSLHNQAVKKAHNLMNFDANIVSGKYGIEKQLAQDVEGARTRLERSVETIRYLMQQGLALWVHLPRKI